MKKLCLVVPCFNEAENVDELARRLLSLIPPPDWSVELLLVDDGSTDGTWEGIRSWAARGRVRGLRLRGNHGVQRAVMTGLAESDSDAAAVLDADLQDPPEAVVPMLRLLVESHGAAAIGIKTVRRDSSRWTSLLKTVATAALPLRPGEGDFCVLARVAVERILRCGRERTPFRVRRRQALRGLDAAYYPYERSPRSAGSGKFGFAKLASLWLRMMLECYLIPAREGAIALAPVSERA